MDETTIQQLLTPKAFPHEAFEFKIIETHISWVVLTGQYAYKIKKPVNLGFVDYTSLEKRHEFCDTELSINRSLAPELYIEVVPITAGDHPQISGKGKVIDYAIKMHQFDQSRLLSNVHREEGLSKAIVQSLADQIALFHERAEKVDEQSAFGTPEQVMLPVRDNFKTLLELEPSKPYADKIKKAQIWAEQQFEILQFLIKRRKEQQHVKVCHGDIHLGNIVLLEGAPRIFDAIEFNDDFRFLDTMNDVAFLCMDLDHKGYSNLSKYFANLYLEHSGDYEGALLLNFYKAYRAMVRAKVSVFQILGLADHQTAQKEALEKDLVEFLDLALTYQKTTKPSLTITFGASGSGKSFQTEKLMTEENTIRIRSDVLRKQMFDLDPYQPCPKPLNAKVYSQETTRKVYQTLSDLTRTLLTHQLNVIIDATFLKAWQRALFIHLSEELHVDFKILVFDHDKEKLESRIEQRLKTNDSSDADAAILEQQLKAVDPLTPNELSYTVHIDE